MIRVSEDGNCRRDGSEAMYKQLRQSLIQLQEAADKIFDTISDRITSEREKLRHISARIQSAKDKIDAISHSNHPKMVKSLSTYPSKSTSEVDYIPLFSYKDGPDSAGFPELFLDGGLNREFGVDGTLELFRFFTETSFESLPKEVSSKVSDCASYLKGTTYSEHLVAPSKVPNKSAGLRFCYLGSGFWTHVLKIGKAGDPAKNYLLQIVFKWDQLGILEDFLMKDCATSDSKCKPDNQGLPPPPPSLLMHSSQLPPRSESFNFRPAVMKLQSLMLSDIHPDFSRASNSVFSGVRSQSTTSEDHSSEAGCSILVSGKGATHQSADL